MYSEYSWNDEARSPKFATWADEITHAETLGYKLVPPDYHIPHWATAMQMGDALPKLYVMRETDGMSPLSTHFDRPARDIAYPLYFRASPVTENAGESPAPVG